MVYGRVMVHNRPVMLSDSETSYTFDRPYKILRFAQDDKMVLCPLVYFVTVARRTDKNKNAAQKTKRRLLWTFI